MGLGAIISIEGSVSRRAYLYIDNLLYTLCRNMTHEREPYRTYIKIYLSPFDASQHGY
jgi:hypothetical protein